MIIKYSLSGQSILEVVIATTLISMGVIAALSLTNQSQKSSNYAKILDQATAYNNQLADYLRSQKNSLGYASLTEKFAQDQASGSVIYCFASLPSNEAFFTLTPGDCGEGDYIQNTFFRRSAQINTSSLASGLIPIVITTTWQDNVERRAILNLELTQWK